MKNADRGFVRKDIAPILPPPPTEAGIRGWFYHNIIESMSNFSTPLAAFISILMGILTFFLAYIGITQIWGLLDFAIFSAVWFAPEGAKREVCLTVDQGGLLPSGWHGACWPFVAAKMKFLMYGTYPREELWRVNIAGIIGFIGLGWVMIENIPYRRYVGVALLTVYPLVTLVLLTGGNFEAGWNEVITAFVAGMALVTISRLASFNRLGPLLKEFSGFLEVCAWLFVAYAVILAFVGYDFGFRQVRTNEWGGLLVTLVVAVSGIVASLPLGILLALARRSDMPVARILSTIFIEFWRGVPLITVLFMASVMLPLFLPEGVNFDNLLRALIGVMLFSAAYMAEVIRGGLQAMDKGQFEGADALGLSYWQKMRLIILPQALTHVIPGIVNTFIGLFKDTTLVSIVGIFDMLGAVQSTYADASWSTPIQDETGYLFIVFIYFIFCFSMSRYSIYMEYKLSTSRKN